MTTRMVGRSRSRSDNQNNNDNHHRNHHHPTTTIKSQSRSRSRSTDRTLLFSHKQNDNSTNKRGGISTRGGSHRSERKVLTSNTKIQSRRKGRFTDRKEEDDNDNRSEGTSSSKSEAESSMESSSLHSTNNSSDDDNSESSSNGSHHSYRKSNNKEYNNSNNKSASKSTIPFYLRTPTGSNQYSSSHSRSINNRSRSTSPGTPASAPGDLNNVRNRSNLRRKIKYQSRGKQTNSRQQQQQLQLYDGRKESDEGSKTERDRSSIQSFESSVKTPSSSSSSSKNNNKNTNNYGKRNTNKSTRELRQRFQREFPDEPVPSDIILQQVYKRDEEMIDNNNYENDAKRKRKLRYEKEFPGEPIPSDEVLKKLYPDTIFTGNVLPISAATPVEILATLQSTMLSLTTSNHDEKPTTTTTTKTSNSTPNSRQKKKVATSTTTTKKSKSKRSSKSSGKKGSSSSSSNHHQKDDIEAVKAFHESFDTPGTLFENNNDFDIDNDNDINIDNSNSQLMFDVVKDGNMEVGKNTNSQKANSRSGRVKTKDKKAKKKPSTSSSSKPIIEAKDNTKSKKVLEHRSRSKRGNNKESCSNNDQFGVTVSPISNNTKASQKSPSAAWQKREQWKKNCRTKSAPIKPANLNASLNDFERSFHGDSLRVTVSKPKIKPLVERTKSLDMMDVEMEKSFSGDPFISLQHSMSTPNSNKGISEEELHRSFSGDPFADTAASQDVEEQDPFATLANERSTRGPRVLDSIIPSSSIPDLSFGPYDSSQKALPVIGTSSGRRAPSRSRSNDLPTTKSSFVLEESHTPSTPGVIRPPKKDSRSKHKATAVEIEMPTETENFIDIHVSEAAAPLSPITLATKKPVGRVRARRGRY